MKNRFDNWANIVWGIANQTSAQFLSCSPPAARLTSNLGGLYQEIQLSEIYDFEALHNCSLLIFGEQPSFTHIHIHPNEFL